MDQRFGVCDLSLAPLREEPSDRSEMCSQLLFGDHFTILEQDDHWLRIQTAFDNYEGWIDHKQFAEIDQTTFVILHDLHTILGLSQSHLITRAESNETLFLLAGSNIPSGPDDYFNLGSRRFKLVSQTIRPSTESFSQDIAHTALFYRNAPYLWGGRSIFGIDCSGFTQMVFKQFGIKLLRDAWMQAEQGELVAFLQEVRVGDLAFFDNEEGKIIHVGIMLDQERIIHASGRVKIDRIDSQGIYSVEQRRYTHKLRVLKRMA